MVSIRTLADRAPLVMALLAGGAFAAAIFLVPAALLERVILETGLPSVLAAAEPPLGFTARASLGASGGLILAFAAWIVLSFAESRRVEDAEEDWEEGTLFRLSRGDDFDTPILRPIFAQTDLGAPFNSVNADAGPLDLGALPLEPVPVRDAAPAAMPVADVIAEAEYEEIVPEQKEARLWQPDPWFDVLRDPEPDLEIPLRPAFENPKPMASLSLAELVSRLEAGMQRRNKAHATATISYMRPAPVQDMDEALRDALGTLQRLAARSR